MNMVLGYGSVVVLLVVIVLILERSAKTADNLSEYATAGRSFGVAYATMSFLNTWLPGTIFISFAGLAASGGIIGYYFVPYSLLAVVLMFLLARPVNVWGRAFDLRTQADFIGLRYGSRAVRVITATIGLVASVPWVVLGMQSLSMVFSYLSFGRVSPADALIVGVLVLAVRQIWTVRFGARGIVISDMIQGILAYGLGGLLALGMLTWLVTNGHGFGQLPESAWMLPGPGSALGGLYFFSLLITGALGGWCWPDIFVRLFAAKSTETIQRSAVQAAPMLLLFGTALTFMAMAASSRPDVAAAPDAVWFLVAASAGVLVVVGAGICVLCATMGNVGANLQALGTIAVNDVLDSGRESGQRSPRHAMIAVGVLTVLCTGLALLTTGITSGLINIALVSYQGIVQIAPALFLGIFWRRATANGAATGLIGGFVTAAALQWLYPVSVPWAGGMTSGVVGLVVNTGLIVVISLMRPNTPTEQDRVDHLFARLEASRAGEPEPALIAGEGELA